MRIRKRLGITLGVIGTLSLVSTGCVWDDGTLLDPYEEELQSEEPALLEGVEQENVAAVEDPVAFPPSPWQQEGFRQNGQHWNRNESLLSVDNVDSLVRKWRTPFNVFPLGEAAVVGGRVFVSATTIGKTGEVVVAFDPETGRILWRGAGFGGSRIAAAFGNVYVTGDRLWVFRQNCRDDGGVCQPRWTAETGRGPLAPVVTSDRTVYVFGAGTLYEFPADCGPKGGVCEPLWRSDVAATMKPTVANGWVYTLGQRDEDGRKPLLVYPVGCRDDGGVCEPVRSSLVEEFGSGSRFAIAHGRIFIAQGNHMKVYSTGCGLRGEEVCKVLWRTAERTAMIAPPAIADGVVYANTAVDGKQSGLGAYPFDCRRDGGVCEPMWTYPQGMGHDTPTIANGVLYSASGLITAFPAVCDEGTVCEELWDFPAPSIPPGVTGSVVIANGQAYIAAADGKFYAFGLPSDSD